MFCNFEEISPEAKVWVYQSNRALTTQEVSEINHQIIEFINSWTAHQQVVKGFGEVKYNRFIVLCADSFTSGCSIDTSVHFIKRVGALYNIDFFDRLSIAYLKDDNQSTDTFRLNKLQALYEEQKISDDTIIFNNLVANKQALLDNWQVKLADSFLAEKLKVKG